MTPQQTIRVEHSTAEADRALRGALWLALVFAAVKFTLQTIGNLLIQHAGYGIFRDELYYIVCGRNLAWGYVDEPPMVAVVAHVSELLFGLHSLALFRVFASLAGAIEVGLTGLIAWRLGGSRWAQAIAMVGILLAPEIIGMDSFLSMNSFEPVFWMVIAFALLQIVRGQQTRASLARWWMVTGVAGGLTLEDKWNGLFFLICALAALWVSPQRKVLRSKWFAVCVALIVLLALPNLLWEIRYHWPTLEWLRNDASEDKNIRLGPLAFFGNQMFIFGPLMAPLWISGVLWLLFARAARPYRFAGILYTIYLPMMIVLHAKDYYLAAIYPLYFAAGAAAWDGWFRAGWLRRWLVPAYVGLTALGIALLLPMILPVLPPAQTVAFFERTHLKPHETQTFDHAPLPQFYADMLGWREMANKLADAYWSLPPQERAKAVIYGKNYGDASAVNVYRPDVPVAISGHQNYFLWGPRGHHGQVMIIIGDTRETDEKEFQSVREYARTTNPYVEPYERRTIFICKGLYEDLYVLWPKVKFYY